MRRSAERMRRASIPRRAVSPASVPQSETPYFSPAQTFSSPVFASSPLSRSWKPAQQTFSPNLYSSPTTGLESPEAAASCAFNGQPCVTTTPILTSPLVGYGASTFALSSPVLDGTPRMTQSPIMSPLMESSRRFTSPTPSYESRGFRTQAQYGSAETQGPAPGAPGSGFYNAVIATSIIGAAMCMGAFGILAWLLFRRRSPYQRPVISHPILKYSSTDSNNGDDENEKSPIQNSGQFRQVEAPTIPESVLPSNTWRPSMQYPVDGFGNPDQMMRDTVHTVRSHQSYHPEQAMSADIMRNMPGALINNDHATYSHREHEVPLQRKASLGRQQNLSRPPLALMRHNSIHEDRHRARFADDPLYQTQINPPPEQQLQQSKSHHQPTEDHGNSHDPRQMEASVEGGRPPVPLRARSTSKSSISSQQQASWELRKAAIIASAHTTNADATRAPPTAASSPVNLDDTEVRNPAEPASPPSTVLSNSVSLVMLDKQLQEAKTTAQKQRPISQDGSAVRNKLKKGSQYHGKKVRPVTIGAAPPSILVTNHPQALVPPPSPKPSQRMSLYSLTDTLPYLASSSQSMASLGTAMAQDDISLVDPMHSGRSSTQSYDRRTSFAESSIASEDGAYRCSLADSCRSEPTADPNTDEERAKRSQRRRTLLESVYKQEEEHKKAGNATQKSASPHNGNDDPFTQHSDYQTPGKSSMRVKNKVLPQAALPLTPPYTPKDLPTVRAQEELSVETPTRRSRSVSAGEPVEQPSLDASLTRFSQIDLGSEFSLSKFGSIGSLKSAAKGDKDGNTMASSTEDRDSASPFKRSTNQNSKRLSVHGGETSASSGEAVAKPARRARASTISCDQFKANTTESMMTTAARVPLPLRSKATRVSFAPAAPSPPPTGTTRSIAQDLRASVNYPTGYDASASRPNSYRTTMSSCRVSSEYDFDHVIDFADSARTSAFSTSSNGSASQHKRKDAMSRVSNGSLGVPDEDDDDGSVCEYSRGLRIMSESGY